MCNASGLATTNVTILAALRGASGALCSVICVVLLMAIFFRSDRNKSVHRLLTYIGVSSLATLLIDMAQVTAIGCNYAWHRPVCEIVGFFEQLTAWVLLLQVSWLAGIIGIHYWWPNYGGTILTSTRELVAWLVIVFASIILALIPIGTRGYGMNGAWCWIKSSRAVEQWVLWYGWLFPTIAAITVILGLSTRHSEKELEIYYHSSHGAGNTANQNRQAEVRRIKKLILCIVAYTIVVLMMVILCFVPSVNNTTAFLVVVAITEPMSKLAVPVVLASHLHNAPVTKQDVVRGDYKGIHNSHRERLVKSVSGDYCGSSGSGSYGKRESGTSNERGGYSGDITGSLLTTDTDRSELSSTI